MKIKVNGEEKSIKELNKECSLFEVLNQLGFKNNTIIVELNKAGSAPLAQAVFDWWQALIASHRSTSSIFSSTCKSLSRYRVTSTG